MYEKLCSSLPLPKEELKSYKYVKVCYICGKRIIKFKDKNYRKDRDHFHYTCKYRGAVHSICNLKFNLPNEIPVVFHNSSNYDYHFIIKQLANDFEGKFDRLAENKEKEKRKKMTKFDNDGNESVETISYKIKFINNAKFIASSLSNLVDNVAKGIDKINCKDCDCFLEYESVPENLIKYKLLSCNKDYSNMLDERLKKKFSNTFKFSNNDINKFTLLLKKGVYPILINIWIIGKILMKQHYMKKNNFIVT